MSTLIGHPSPATKHRSGPCQPERRLKQLGNFLQILPRLPPGLQISNIIDIMTGCIYHLTGLVKIMSTTLTSNVITR